jgi:hypothetical protein
MACPSHSRNSFDPFRDGRMFGLIDRAHWYFLLSHTAVSPGPKLLSLFESVYLKQLCGFKCFKSEGLFLKNRSVQIVGSPPISSLGAVRTKQICSDCGISSYKQPRGPENKTDLFRLWDLLL